MRQKNIYIVLTRTTTLLSQTIAYVTGKQYTHASISLTRDLQTMYSFGRKWRYNPFIGGFRRENLEEGLFAGCKILPYAVVQIKVTPEQYERANFIIQKYLQNADSYSYNYIGLLFAWVGKVHKCRNRFYCSEFVYDLLKQCGIISHEMPSVIQPQDLMRYGQIIEAGDRRSAKHVIKPAKTADMAV